MRVKRKGGVNAAHSVSYIALTFTYFYQLYIKPEVHKHNYKCFIINYISFYVICRVTNG